MSNWPVAVNIYMKVYQVAVAEVGQVLIKHVCIPIDDVITTGVTTALIDRGCVGEVVFLWCDAEVAPEPHYFSCPIINFPIP